MAFKCDLKIDLIMFDPHHVKLFCLWTLSIVKLFEFLTFDILLYLTGNEWRKNVAKNHPTCPPDVYLPSLLPPHPRNIFVTSNLTLISPSQEWNLLLDILCGLQILAT